MSLEILVAVRRSPAELVGAKAPIAVIDVGAPHRMWLWYPRERTTRLHRDSDLAGVVTVTCVARWADFAIEYAKLIARGFDGIVAIDGEVLDVELDPPLDSRDLAIAWHELDARAAASLETHQQATHRERLAWDPSAVWLEREATPTPQPLS